VKPKLLVVELWGLGDLVIATPFLRAASERYEVTLLAKPYALQLQARLWPGVRVITFVAPWTAFKGKYHLWRWPWRTMGRLRKQLRNERFDAGVSARWDPRDHAWLLLGGAKMRLGFPRLGSQQLLTYAVTRPEPTAHRYEYWRTLGDALDLKVPGREAIFFPARRPADTVLVHSGAGQPIRVWPLERYQAIVQRLRAAGRHVLVACDPAQTGWWRAAGEARVATPQTVNELLALIDQAGVFVGNDSGPGHLAAFCGVPTLSIFGPQVPEWFTPLHPATRWIEGKACPYKPCSDYCRMPAPRCLDLLSADEVWSALERLLAESPQTLRNEAAGLGG
jgi:ADP-heptose:LPS heptosyltransferase